MDSYTRVLVALLGDCRLMYVPTNGSDGRYRVVGADAPKPHIELPPSDVSQMLRDGLLERAAPVGATYKLTTTGRRTAVIMERDA